MPASKSPSQAPREGERYCLITPCRNEAAFIRTTLESTTAQTLRPARWIIVDDGSTDETPEILADFAARFDFIRVVKRADRGQRAVGPGVVEAFYDGLATIDLDEFDFVCKFDGDLEMPPRYFESAVKLMQEDPVLGNVSGKLFGRMKNGELKQEKTADENAVGPVKFYRTACFKAIGGFVREVAWDGIDGHLCRMNGWIAQSVDHPEMRIIHLRQMGSSQKNIWVGRQRWGRGKYFMGSAWYYAVAAAGYRMFDRPFMIGGIGIFTGYVRAALSRHPRFSDPEYRRFLREYEQNVLLNGRRRTLESYNKRIRSAAALASPSDPLPQGASVLRS
ncbi:MAG: biofilm PGA synthesis N-glycosyltransferase PgaC [Paracoccaceae bacterium]|jgi:glycosyltransferase involved in cell wall biosynthesis